MVYTIQYQTKTLDEFVLSDSEAIQERESRIMSNISRDPVGGQFCCLICSFIASSRHKVFCHIEAKHFQDSAVIYSCPKCAKTLGSRNSLGIHMSRNHRGAGTKNSIFPKEIW